MAYSFYGGKEGTSFLIKDRFDSVLDMTSAFAKGGVYNKVGYGEFVIIDTLDKSDYENGVVYRRGFDYNSARKTVHPRKTDTETITITQGSLSKEVQNRVYWNDTHTLSIQDGVVIDTVKKGGFNEVKYMSAAESFLRSPGAGAIYVGRFAGPEGGTSPVELISWDDFVEVYDGADEGDYNDHIVLSRSNGKTTDIAKGGYCTLRDAYGNVSHSYFSLDLPFDVFEIQAESVSPYGPSILNVDSLPSRGPKDIYYKVGDTYYLFENERWVERTPWSVSKISGDSAPIYFYEGLVSEKQESEGHPYYHSYDIKVPKGIHGKNINQVGINITGRRDSSGDIDQSDHNYEWFFEATDFEDSEDGSFKRTYLNNFNKVIDRITTNTQSPDNIYNRIERNHNYNIGDNVLLPVSHPNNGTLMLICSTSGTTGISLPAELGSRLSEGYHFSDGTVKWTVIQKEAIPPGIATVHYTHDGNEDFSIRLLQSLQCDDDGRMFAKYSNIEHRSYVGDNRSIIGVGYNSDPRVCRFYIKYNTFYRTADGTIEPHSTFTYNEDNTDVTIFPFTDSEGREIEYIDEKIEFAVNLAIDPDTKRLSLIYNTGRVEPLDVFKTISHTYIREPDKRFVVGYNTGEEEVLNVFRTIQRLYWNDDYKLVVVYNAEDPDSGQPIEQVLTDDYEMKYVENLYISNEGNLSKEKYFQSDFIVGKDDTSDDGFKHEVKRVSVRPLNDIVAIKLVGDNLMVLYSSPAYRASLSHPYIMEYEGVEYQWANFGPILAGNHIIGNFNTLEELKLAYPYGFGKTPSGAIDPTTQNRMGWIATVGDSTTEDYKLYAYNYQKSVDSPNNWYLIQKLGADLIDPRYSCLVALDDGSGVPEDSLDSYLNEHGCWFVVTD